jgi:hypothetical protein
LAIGHAGEGTGQEFERALACLLGCVHLANVENVEETARESKNEVVTNGVHEVDTLGELVRGLLFSSRAWVPKPDGAIPGTSNDGVWHD